MGSGALTRVRAARSGRDEVISLSMTGEVATISHPRSPPTTLRGVISRFTPDQLRIIDEHQVSGHGDGDSWKAWPGQNIAECMKAARETTWGALIGLTSTHGSRDLPCARARSRALDS